MQLQGFAIVREEQYAPDRVTIEAVRIKKPSPLASKVEKERF
jgi:hypothetical protein